MRAPDPVRLALASAWGLVALASAPAWAQGVPLPSDGYVTGPGREPIEVTLTGPAVAPIGARVLTYRRVEVNGQDVGVLTGMYRVVGAAPGGIVRASLDPARGAGLPGGALNDRAQIETDAQPGQLAVTTDPPGARILWAGIPVGTTPDTLTLTSGRHLLRFEVAGYLHQTAEFSVGAGSLEHETLVLVRPRPCRAFLDDAYTRFETEARAPQVAGRYSFGPAAESLQLILQQSCAPALAEAGAQEWYHALDDIATALERASARADRVALAIALRELVIERARGRDGAHHFAVACQQASVDPYVQSFGRCPSR